MDSIDSIKFNGRSLEEICKKMEIPFDRGLALFNMGYTAGFLSGQKDAQKGRRPSSSIPDAETR